MAIRIHHQTKQCNVLYRTTWHKQDTYLNFKFTNSARFLCIQYTSNVEIIQYQSLLRQVGLYDH